jgi:hypothetical protein
MKKRFSLVVGVLVFILAMVIPFNAYAAKAADKLMEKYFPNGFSKDKPLKPVINTGDGTYIAMTIKQSDDILKLARDFDKALEEQEEKGLEYSTFEEKYNVTGFDMIYQCDISVDGGDWQYNKKWDSFDFDTYEGGFARAAYLGTSYTDNSITFDLMDPYNADSGVLKKTVKNEAFDLKNHTFKVRCRAAVQYTYLDTYLDGTDADVHYFFSDWSDTVTFGKTTDQNLEIPDELPMPDISEPKRSLDNNGKWGNDIHVMTHISKDVTDAETALVISTGIQTPMTIVVESALNDLTEKKFKDASIGNAVWMSDGNRGVALDYEKLSLDSRLLIRAKIICEEIGKESKYDYAVDKVKGLKVKKAKTTSLTLTWNKVADAEFYEIYDKDNKLVATSKTNSVTIKKLKAATGYDYKVRAVVDKVFVGLFSDTLQCATMPKKSKVTKAALSGEALTLTYKKVAGSGYQIQVATDKKFKSIVAEKTVKDSKTVKLSETIEGASEYKGKTLYVRVRAYFNYGSVTTNASWSKVKSFTAK